MSRFRTLFHILENVEGFSMHRAAPTHTGLCEWTGSGKLWLEPTANGFGLPNAGWLSVFLYIDCTTIYAKDSNRYSDIQTASFNHITQLASDLHPPQLLNIDHAFSLLSRL